MLPRYHGFSNVLLSRKLSLTAAVLKRYWHYISALAEKQTFRLERTWQGFPVEDPAEILLLQNHQVKETHMHVHWVQDSEAGYQNTSMSIFLSNDQNMTLRLDLDASTAKASFLWGPNGNWGCESHTLDPKSDNHIDGGFESNFSTNIWEAQVRFPWDFLPPTVMRIQVIEYFT